MTVTRLCHPDCECLYLGLCRFAYEQSFERTEMAFLDLLSPHLQSALATQQTLRVLADPRLTEFPEAMHTNTAFSLIDLTAHQVSLSPAAEKILSALDCESNG
ncbi:MAG: hypothetical protein R6V19_06525, partial [Armatimonadota bacterium]